MGGEGEIGNLLACVKDDSGASHEKRLCLARFHTGKCPFEIVSRFNIDEDKGQPEFVCRLVQCCPFKPPLSDIDVPKDSHSVEVRYDFLEDLQSLSVGLQRGFGGYAGHVPARIRKALSQSQLHWVADRYKHSRHGAG